MSHCAMPTNWADMFVFLFHHHLRANKVFDLIHCDLWTSPVPSVSGHKYYLIILDDHTHYLWTFPLRLKSEVFNTLTHFFAFAKTQFSANIRSIQCDNGGEFDNIAAPAHTSSHKALHSACCVPIPQQNDKAERIIHSTNDILRSLLFQASLP